MYERKRTIGIYKATNIITGICYIGQTKFTLVSRKAAHKRRSKDLTRNSPFHKAIRESGFENFEWEMVCLCTIEELDKKEREVIARIGIENCYNVVNGGKSNFTFPEEYKKLFGTQKFGKNNPQYGKKRTKEEMRKCKEASMEVCSKKVKNIETGEIYPSVSECARQNNCSVGNVSMHCNGKIKTQKYRFL